MAKKKYEKEQPQSPSKFDNPGLHDLYDKTTVEFILKIYDKKGESCGEIAKRCRDEWILATRATDVQEVLLRRRGVVHRLEPEEKACCHVM